MSIPKDQHYIPRMLLKRFTDKEGNLYFFDKENPKRGIRKRAPKNLFHGRHLYTMVEEDGTQDASVETEYLAVLESEASPIIEKIVSGARRGFSPDLSSWEKDVWVTFFYKQFGRVPETRETHTEKIRQEILREIEFIGHFLPFTDRELSMLDDEETMERLFKNSAIQSVRLPTPKEVYEILSAKHICAAVVRQPKPKRSFVIGSIPVLKLSHPERSHLADPTVEVWLPLARDVAVTPCPGERAKLISIQDRHIRSINKSIFQQSTVIAGCSREIIESLLGEGERLSPL